jgi:glycosyltransferase involved in cell wall biosynthesis
MRKRTILVDTRMLRNSGIGVYIQNLLKYFKMVTSVELLKAADQVSQAEVVCNLKSSIYSLKEQLEMSKQIMPVDLFWSPHYNIPVFPIRAKKRVVTIHDVYHLAFAADLSLFQKWYARIMIKIAVVKSDAIITVSQFSKQEIIRFTGCDADKITVIYNGIDQQVTRKDSSYINNKYKLPEKPYLLFVGNVKPHKNLFFFLQAFKDLEKSLYEAYEVVIVGRNEGMITGDPRLFSWLKQHDDLAKKVTFTGLVDDEDLNTIYANASLFIFPSYYEGFGLPPLEAMLNGCPVVASNAASIPEICADAAVYFNPFDKEEITASISRVLEDKKLAEDLRVAGHDRVKAFTWENAGKMHLDVFEKIINTKY